MRNSLVVSDPTTALMLTHLDVGIDGRVHPVRRDLRSRQRHYLRLARLRKLLA
jgi:hypothetical protein